MFFDGQKQDELSGRSPHKLHKRWNAIKFGRKNVASCLLVTSWQIAQKHVCPANLRPEASGTSRGRCVWQSIGPKVWNERLLRRIFRRDWSPRCANTYALHWFGTSKQDLMLVTDLVFRWQRSTVFVQGMFYSMMRLFTLCQHLQPQSITSSQRNDQMATSIWVSGLCQIDIMSIFLRHHLQINRW